MELKEQELEQVLGGANPAVIDENNNVFRSNGELSEEQLEGVYAGPNREAMINKAVENKEVFRERSVEEIEKEKQELIRQREEIFQSRKSM